MMEYGLDGLRNLKELIFMVSELNGEGLEKYRSLRRNLEGSHRHVESVRRRRGVLIPPPSIQVQDCKIGVKSGCHFSIVG